MQNYMLAGLSDVHDTALTQIKRLGLIFCTRIRVNKTGVSAPDCERLNHVRLRSESESFLGKVFALIVTVPFDALKPTSKQPP